MSSSKSEDQTLVMSETTQVQGETYIQSVPEPEKTYYTDAAGVSYQEVTNEPITFPYYQPVEFTLMKSVKDTFEPKAPLHGSETSGGFDLYVAKDTIVMPNGSILVSTGVCMKIPEGWCGQINPRSGVASQSKLRIGARLIDSDYRGEVMVNIHNDSPTEITKIVRGDRIAQIVFVPHLKEMVMVESLDETERGDGGFGSTGV